MREHYKKFYKMPRCYTESDLREGGEITLDSVKLHHIGTVLRLGVGANIRMFNTRDGEWLAEIITLNKKNGALKLIECIKPQPTKPEPLRLLFAPIKKNRMDFLIEKAVELGVTGLYPVITARTQIGKINEAKINAQIIDTIQQCERLHRPTLHLPQKLKTALTAWKHESNICWAAERHDGAYIKTINNPRAFLIGPEGGFDDSENAFLSSLKHVQPVSLGENILRAETAALFCLAQASTLT